MTTFGWQWCWLVPVLTTLVLEKLAGPMNLGEGPHWDSRSQTLYFVDVRDQTLHRYHPSSDRHTKTARLDGRPGFVVPVEGHLDQFFIGLEREFVVVRWDGEEGSSAKIVRRLGEVDHHEPGNRLNDGKADPRGRIFAGTMGPDMFNGPDKINASLYRIDERGVVRVDHGIGVSNGMAWDLTAKAMYYIDSVERKIRRYDYDVETGEIWNMRHIFDLAAYGLTAGWPDGCTIDTAGNLWVAVIMEGCLLNVSPQGQLLRRVNLPVRQVTSCTFGGPNLDDLFVTSGSQKLNPEEDEPRMGCTFKLTGLGVQGYPNINFRF